MQVENNDPEVENKVLKQEAESIDPNGGTGGVALGFTFFVMAIVLYFDPTHVGSATKWIAAVSAALGFMGIGLDLNNADELLELTLDHERGKGIYDNLGMGIGVLIVWGLVAYGIDQPILNFFALGLLFFGLYGVLLGIANYVVDSALSVRTMKESQIAKEAPLDNQKALLERNDAAYYSRLKTAFLRAAVVIGLFSGTVTVLQFFGINLF